MLPRAAAAVALVLALGLPVAQLATAQVVWSKCCCPDVERCHCPGHDRGDDGSSIQSCGRSRQVLPGPQLPPFEPPPVVEVVLVARPMLAPPSLAAPRPGPDLERPTVPS